VSDQTHCSPLSVFDWFYLITANTRKFCERAIEKKKNFSFENFTSGSTADILIPTAAESDRPTPLSFTQHQSQEHSKGQWFIQQVVAVDINKKKKWVKANYRKFQILNIWLQIQITVVARTQDHHSRHLNHSSLRIALASGASYKST
jgi:hypothetical protein